jgi:hypothetical protein
MYKEVIANHTFIQNNGDVVRVYEGTGDVSGLDPVYISKFRAKTRKEFEMEVSYILVYYLKWEG